MDSDPLNAREARAWRAYNEMREQLMSHLARRLARDCGLTEADYAVLVNVSEAPDRRMRSRDLGRRLGWDRSRLSHQISRMESRGTIERAVCEGDARGFDVVLTDAGLAAIEGAAPAHLAEVRHCFVDLLSSRQLDVLTSIASTVLAHLEDEHADERP